MYRPDVGRSSWAWHMPSSIYRYSHRQVPGAMAEGQDRVPSQFRPTPPKPAKSRKMSLFDQNGWKCHFLAKKVPYHSLCISQFGLLAQSGALPGLLTSHIGLLGPPWRHTKQYIISQEKCPKHAILVGGGTLGNKVDRGNFYTIHAETGADSKRRSQKSANFWQIWWGKNTILCKKWHF